MRKKLPKKLKIEFVYVPALQISNSQSIKHSDQKIDFDFIWENYIKKLEGKTLKRDNGETNKILQVDWSGVKRITSNGKQQLIKIEIFKLAINHILNKGEITRKFINEEYKEKASSGIVLILSQVLIFEQTMNPLGIKLKKRI